MWECNLVGAGDCAGDCAGAPCFIKIVCNSSQELANLRDFGLMRGLHIVPVLRFAAIEQLDGTAVIMSRLQTLRTLLKGDVASWAPTVIPRLCQVAC